jgi:hypothetical protein
MMPKHNELTIPMQIGTELRIKKDGQIAIDNPTLELEPSDAVADAVLTYRFEKETGDHVLRLVEPLAFNPRREIG